MICRRDDLALLVEQNVIDPPRIGADAGNRQASLHDLLQALLQARPKLRNVPMQASISSFRRIVESMNFFEGKATPLETAEHESTAFRAQIAGQIMRAHAASEQLF